MQHFGATFFVVLLGPERVKTSEGKQLTAYEKHPFTFTQPSRLPSRAHLRDSGFIGGAAGRRASMDQQSRDALCSCKGNEGPVFSLGNPDARLPSLRQ